MPGLRDKFTGVLADTTTKTAFRSLQKLCVKAFTIFSARCLVGKYLKFLLLYYRIINNLEVVL